MKTTVETLDDDRVKFSIEVDEDEFETRVDTAYKKIARDVNMPGFRKGKVPRRVLEAKYGAGIARGQAIEDSVPDYFLSALNDHEVDLIGPPDYEITSGAEDGPLAFDAVVQVRPVATISGYDSLEVEVPNLEPADEDLEEQINRFLDQFAELESVERPAAADDTVTIDIATTHDGEELEGLTADDYSYRVGSGGLVDELDENLTGAKPGDVLEFTADHPDPETDGELAFRILVKDVQQKVLPELTDEVVANATDFETAEDFRNDLDERLRHARMDEAASMWRERSAEALGQLVEIEPPEAMVDAEVRNRVEGLAQRLAQSGIGLEQYLQMIGQDPADMVEQMREPALSSVKVDLALRALAQAEGLEATEDDVTAEFDQLAEMTGAPVDDLRNQISSPNQLMQLRGDIAKRKAVDWLLENVAVVDESGNPVDTQALQDHIDSHNHDHHDHAHGEEE